MWISFLYFLYLNLCSHLRHLKFFFTCLLELNRKEIDVVTTPDKEHTIVHEPKLKVDLTKYLENQIFRFDCTFDETSTNELVYKYV